MDAKSEKAKIVEVIHERLARLKNIKDNPIFHRAGINIVICILDQLLEDIGSVEEAHFLSDYLYEEIKARLQDDGFYCGEGQVRYTEEDLRVWEEIIKNLRTGWPPRFKSHEHKDEQKRRTKLARDFLDAVGQIGSLNTVSVPYPPWVIDAKTPEKVRDLLKEHYSNIHVDAVLVQAKADRLGPAHDLLDRWLSTPQAAGLDDLREETKNFMEGAS